LFGFLKKKTMLSIISTVEHDDARLEGPESGVYYRGQAQLTDGEIWIELPSYVSRLAKNLTVQLTQINSNRDDGFARLRAGHVTGQGFTVYGDACQFAWHVFGTRADIHTEPLRDDCRRGRLLTATFADKKN
jgi:hypothetical protein